MSMCDKCKEFRLSRDLECKCKKFEIINEDGDPSEVWALDDYFAALRYAETSNEENDYYLMNESIDILVNGKAFTIGAEPDVHYSAKSK